MKMFRKVLLWIFVALISLGQLQRIEFNQYNIAIYIHDVFICLWITQLLFTNPFRFILFIKDYLKTEKKVQLFFSLATLSLLINLIQNSDITSVIYFLRLITYILFGFSISFLVKNKKIEAEYLRFQIFCIGLFSLFLGFIQFIYIKDTRFLSILGWDDHYARLISTYFDPGFTGVIFLLTLLIGLTSTYLQNKKIQFIMLLTFLWGIILTFSRASYLATIVSFSILFLSQFSIDKKIIKKFSIGLFLFIIMVIIAPKPFGEGVNLLRTSTINARANSLTQQLKILNPQTILLGNGPYSQKNSLNYYIDKKTEIIIPSHSRVPDNIFINVLLSTGIFGLLLFIVLLIKWGHKLKQKNIFIYAGFIGILVHTQFNSSLIQPFIFLILLSAIASYKNN